MYLKVNGQEHPIKTNPNLPLLWFLREVLGLTGTKHSCGVGICGRCTVQVDGQAVRSCITPVSAVSGKEIRTIEAMETLDDQGTQIMHTLHQAFSDEKIAQCGWCLNGQILTAAGLLEGNPMPDSKEIAEEMASNFCLCSRYTQIFSSVEKAIEEMSLQQAENNVP